MNNEQLHAHIVRHVEEAKKLQKDDSTTPDEIFDEIMETMIQMEKAISINDNPTLGKLNNHLEYLINKSKFYDSLGEI